MKEKFSKLRRRFFPTMEEEANDYEDAKNKRRQKNLQDRGAYSNAGGNTDVRYDEDGNELPDIYNKFGRLSKKEVQEILKKEKIKKE